MNLKDFIEEGLHSPSVASKDEFLIIADHRDLDDEVVSQLKKGLKKLGINVYNVPGTEGSDTHCLVFSKKTMTKTELKKFNME